MTENAVSAPEGFVTIRNKDTGALGTAPVDAVDYWKANGHEVVDAEELAAAQAATVAYDPSAHNAQEVHDHLLTLDRESTDGAAEYDRIVLAEQQGRNRTTAYPAH